MEVKAPGVLKLLGEHASVYGRLAIAIAADRYARVDARKTGVSPFRLILKDFNGLEVELDKRKLGELYDSYKNKKDIAGYADGPHGISAPMLPYATIAARLAIEQGVSLEGMSATVTSDIPMQSGMASSGACCVAFTVALLRAGKKRLPDVLTVDIARDGDRVVHRNLNAGTIDVNTSYYGGYVSYSAASGAKREDAAARLDLLVVDTGPKKSTAETVGHVAELREQNKERIETVLDKIHECSMKGLDCLKGNDIPTLGACMYMDHELLRELEVSSKGLDNAVSIAREYGAYGAKLSGGGGGGIAIVLNSDGVKRARLIDRYQHSGFKVYTVNTALEGAYNYFPR